MYNGDFMNELKENVELHVDAKRMLKVIAAEKDVTMKELLLNEARDIIDNDYYVPVREREEEENRSSLIVNVPSDFKDNVREFIDERDIKIRDLWVESVDRIIQRYNNV